MTTEMDTVPGFGKDVASFYESYMVPMVFAPYATDLVDHIAARPAGDVLEVAAGTGVVVRALVARELPSVTSIVATDISQAMVDLGQEILPSPAVRWQTADALALPFADESVDTVVCQFGVMFFSDRVKAYSEAFRVLRKGGRLLFNTWDSLDYNDFVRTVHHAVGALFPGQPPTFFERVPHGYHHVGTIVEELHQGGFALTPEIAPVSRYSQAADAATAAYAYTRGTPLRKEIEAHGAEWLDKATAAAQQALLTTFGSGHLFGQTRAFMVTATKNH